MHPENVLTKTLRHEKADSLPWVPFAGVHAGKLIGKTAKEVLTDENALLDALLAVHRLYKPHGQPVMFDLQIEAEILGCDLVWAEDSPPSVKTHPLAETATVPCRCTLPTEEDGRIPMVLRTMQVSISTSIPSSPYFSAKRRWVSAIFSGSSRYWPMV